MSDLFYQSIRVSDDAITQEVDGEMVILDMHGESYFGLDAIGTRVWNLLKEHGNLQEIVSIMLGEFEVSEDELREDLEELLSRLVEVGLVTIEEQGRRA